MTSTAPSVFGHAASRSVLAAISDDLPQGIIFVDDDTQDLLQIGQRIDSDGDVNFYNITRQSFLTVVTNLRMHVAPESQNRCKDTFGIRAERRCYFGIRYRWDDRTQFPVGELALQGFEKFCGGKVEMIASGTVEFKCWEIVLTWQLSFEAFCGAGVKASKAATFTMPKYDTECYTIRGVSFSIWKLRFALVLEGCVGSELKEAIVNVPRSFKYYRIWGVTLKQEGFLSTTEGYQGSASRYKYTSERKNDFDISDIFDLVDNVQLACSIEADIGLQVKLEIPDQEYYFRVGLIVGLKWTFGGDKSRCTCPYLYGSIATSIYFYWKTPELSVLNFKLLPAASARVALIENAHKPEQCLFDPDASKEGLSYLEFEDDPPSWVISNFNFQFDGLNLGKSDFRAKLEVILQDDSVYQDLQFPVHRWDSCFESCLQNWKPFGKMVTILPKSANMRWSASQAVSFFVPPIKDKVDFSPEEGTRSKGLGPVGRVTYVSEKARNVILHREFEGTNSRYVSVKPTVPPGDLIGVVVHSVVGETGYSAAGLEKVIDSSRLTDAVAKEFLAHDYVEIQIKSFTSHFGPIAVLEFLRASKPLKFGRNNQLGVHREASGSDFNLGIIEFDLSDNPPLTIKVGVAASPSDEGRNLTWEIGAAELMSGPEFEIRRASPEAEILLSVTRTQPNVVFQFRDPIKDTQRGLAVRVFVVPVDGTPANIVMAENEVYGLLKVPNGGTEYGGDNRFLISMPGLDPLCHYNELDESVFMIPVESGQTLIDGSIQVPFRRNPTGRFTGTAKVIVLTFATASSGYCGDGIVVPVKEQDVAVRVGCIEEITEGMELLQGWTAAGDLKVKPGRNVILPQDVIRPKEAQTITQKKWRYHGFDVYASQKVDIFPTLHQFPDQIAAITLTADLLDPLRKHNVEIRINCTRATKLNWVRGRLNSNFDYPNGIPAVRNVPGLFAFLPPAGNVSDDLIVWARCNDPEKAFCLFNMDLIGTWLLRYKNPAGIVDPLYTGKGENDLFLRGVTRQLIVTRQNALIYKTWEGPIERVRIKDQDTLTLTYAHWGNWGKLSLTLGNLAIPFSITKCTNDPNGFFAALGFAGSPDGLVAEAVNFTVDGDVQIDPKFFDPALIKNGIDVEKVTGLSSTNVNSGQKFIDTFSAPTATLSRPRGSAKASAAAKGLKKNVMMIAIIACAGVAVVIIITIVVVVCVRKRRESPSHSQDAQETQETQEEPLNQ